jgi:leucyl aminopeptidase
MTPIIPTFAPLNATTASTKTDAVVFMVSSAKKLDADLAALDKKCGGIISTAIDSAAFTAKKLSTLSVHLPKAAGVAFAVLVGVGEVDKLTTLCFEKLGGKAVGELNKLRAKSATIIAAEIKSKKVNAGEQAARIGSGVMLGSYYFDKYFTTKKEDEKPSLTKINIATSALKSAQVAFAELKTLADAVNFTRDIITEPANVIHPESLAAECKKLTKYGLTVKVLGVAEMQKLGMNALLGVGQGSTKESKLVVLEWKGNAKQKQPVAFVGKGVCFDTGGISIKPAGGMEEMKWDMGGSGVVIGLMQALASRKAKVHAVGVVGLVENMPDGNAQRPGDVVKSADGQTIEVLNTDAEGRLVLADALWYAQKFHKPKMIIDLATLTGAIIVALGSSRAGLFTNNDALANQLTSAAEVVGEPMWRLPLGEEYDKQINSDIADMQNIGREREAGSITAAQFLQRFIKNETPWAHLDIAGVAWSKKSTEICAKGATGYGVRLLNQLVADHYEA